MDNFNKNRRNNENSDAGRDGRSYNRNYRQTNRGGDNQQPRYQSKNQQDRNSDYDGNRWNRSEDSSYNRGNRWDDQSKQSYDSNRNRGGNQLNIKKKTYNKPNPTDGGKRVRQRITKGGNSKVVRFDNDDSMPIRNYNRHENYNPNKRFSNKKQIEFKQNYFDPEVPIRLNRYLANSGVCSRREADEHILAGDITVYGEVVTELGTKVLPTDKIEFQNKVVSIERKVYILLNKPKDFVTTVEDTHGRKTVMDLVKNACNERIYPVGRLDRNTTGVLLFTNDGDLASKLTHPQYNKKKIYHVKLSHDLTAEHYEMIINGIELGDTRIKADSLEFVKDNSLSEIGIEIHSGQNRIVRRIFESLGYKIFRLDRVYFAGLTKKGLSRGKYRFLNGKEIAMLKMGAYN